MTLNKIHISLFLLLLLATAGHSVEPESILLLPLFIGEP